MCGSCLICVDNTNVALLVISQTQTRAATKSNKFQLEEKKNCNFRLFLLIKSMRYYIYTYIYLKSSYGSRISRQFTWTSSILFICLRCVYIRVHPRPDALIKQYQSLMNCLWRRRHRDMANPHSRAHTH